MKKSFNDTEKLNYYRKRTKELEQALDRAYSDIIFFLNEGDFSTNITWDAGYIIDLLPKKKTKVPKIR